MPVDSPGYAFTTDQITALAPDAASLKAGKDLTSPQKWPTLAANSRALWGEVQGSGKDPYRTQVDALNLAFKCSCPSRKFPCKHGIGLLLIFANDATPFVFDAPEPAWVSEWMDKRAATKKEPDAAETAKKPKSSEPQTGSLTDSKPDPKTARSLTNRLNTIGAGVADLNRIIEDLIRTGQLSLTGKNAGYWQTIAARLVDAKAPGLAARVKQLGSLPIYDGGTGWHGEALRQLAQLYLLTQAFGRLADLTPDCQEDVKALVGMTIAQKDLLAHPTADTLTDTFVALARQTATEDDLLVQRTYLYGTQSRRYALILNFAHRTAPVLPPVPMPGTAVSARLVFYPGTAPYRAILPDGFSDAQPATGLLPDALPNWTAAQQALTDALAQSPFAAQIPQTVHALRPVLVGEMIYLIDNQGFHWPVEANWPRSAYWHLLALTGGEPVSMTILRLDTTVSPLGVWLASGYQPL